MANQDNRRSGKKKVLVQVLEKLKIRFPIPKEWRNETIPSRGSVSSLRTLASGLLSNREVSAKPQTPTSPTLEDQWRSLAFHTELISPPPSPSPSPTHSSSPASKIQKRISTSSSVPSLKKTVSLARTSISNLSLYMRSLRSTADSIGTGSDWETDEESEKAETGSTRNQASMYDVLYADDRWNCRPRKSMVVKRDRLENVKAGTSSYAMAVAKASHTQTEGCILVQSLNGNEKQSENAIDIPASPPLPSPPGPDSLRRSPLVIIQSTSPNRPVLPDLDTKPLPPLPKPHRTRLLSSYLTRTRMLIRNRVLARTW
ncbi:hypothetical protein SpCBS45565_g00382 [Spizellomyces sp. 'palustris']|nr:hypothetical protein SpCBS45565_g00382 [Spizellomyces sp. 'palustris']